MVVGVGGGVPAIAFLFNAVGIPGMFSVGRAFHRVAEKLVALVRFD